MVIVGQKEVIFDSTIMVLNLHKSLWFIFGLLEVNGHHVGHVDGGLGGAIDFQSVYGDDAQEEEVSDE